MARFTFVGGRVGSRRIWLTIAASLPPWKSFVPVSASHRQTAAA